ncbi:uncharacterized protein LOC106141611 [Amyelois transitella]|uniref:uncharacterized protein LOC106141611 n=1 Tax=Amyelois transitella TaxID=680683 RepID=UPI00067CE344|nr:uncharacterized protein LOC106141611 [Amyelois transitella]
MTSMKLFVLFLVAGAAVADPVSSLHGVDPDTLSCDPAGEIFLLLPHFTNCHKYYMCAHGEEVEFTCPGNNVLYFDFELQTCNWPRDTKCWLRTSPEDIDEGSGSGDDPGFLNEDIVNPVDVLSNIIRPTDVEIHPSNAILNCRNLDSASKQVAYSGDCQRFWRCQNGVPQAAYCSDGLYFNSRTQQCDYEANVQCHVRQEDELNGEFIVYK